MSKGKPIPIRFEAKEDAAIREIAESVGLDNSEVVRRAVRLLYREVKARGAEFVLADLGRLESKKSTAPVIHARGHGSQYLPTIQRPPTLNEEPEGSTVKGSRARGGIRGMGAREKSSER